jgi:hypothetical protein
VGHLSSDVDIDHLPNCALSQLNLRAAAGQRPVVSFALQVERLIVIASSITTAIILIISNVQLNALTTCLTASFRKGRNCPHIIDTLSLH